MRRPGPIPGGGLQTKSLGQERREGRSRVVATGGLPAPKRSWAGKGPTSRRRDLDLPDSDPATEWAKASIPRSLDPPFLAPPHHTFRIGGYARPAEEQRGRWREFLPDSLVGGKGPKKSRAHGSGTGSPPPPSPRPSAPFRLFPGPAPPGSLSCLERGGRPASTQEEPSDPSRTCHEPPRAFFLMILSYALDKRLQLEDLSGLISHSKNEGKNFPLSPLSPGSGKVRTLRSFLKLFPSTGR